MKKQIKEKTSKFQICKLCKKVEELRKSHIIPECHYSDLSKKFEGNDNLIKIEREGDKNKRNVLKNMGLVDYNILCKRCEQLLGTVENKFIMFLRGDKKYDYRSITLAVLGILWKAHITTNEFFKEINIEENLGNKLYEGLYNCLINNEEEIPVDFSICIQKFVREGGYNKDDLLPNMITFELANGVSYFGGKLYYCDLGGHRITIRVGGIHLTKEINIFIAPDHSNIRKISYKNKLNSKPSRQIEKKIRQVLPSYAISHEVKKLILQ